MVSGDTERMNNNAVHVLFLNPARDDPVLNRITSYIGKLTHGVEACHVELSMPHNDGFLTSSIYNGETVNATMSKKFSNPGYDVHTLMVSDIQLGKMKNMVLSVHNRKDSFDRMGMYLACLPVQVPRLSKKNTTFCSKYITEVLQAGGVPEVQTLNSNITTPSKLLKTLIPASRKTVGSVTHKMRSLEKGAVFSYTSIPTAQVHR
jgi:hypothetical protein